MTKLIGAFRKFCEKRLKTVTTATCCDPQHAHHTHLNISYFYLEHLRRIPPTFQGRINLESMLCNLVNDGLVKYRSEKK